VTVGLSVIYELTVCAQKQLKKISSTTESNSVIIQLMSVQCSVSMMQIYVIIQHYSVKIVFSFERVSAVKSVILLIMNWCRLNTNFVTFSEVF